ncbi:replication protein [Hafnia alvei]|uniref:replication protein n=1 Tax=Hafnia alvei TaxID=569 RepID=UPI002DB72B92|nr:replication protein [Hafnia alvei]MEB7890999.1 replication protein [Hafnia alvei]
MTNTAEIIPFRAPARQEDKSGGRVADLDDGYTRLATMLLEALISADLTKRQYKVAFAVIRLTYGWNKPRDRISNSQISELTNLPIKKVSEARIQLTQMHVFISVGRVIGINKAVSEWNIPQNRGISPKTGENKSPKTGESYPPKRGYTIDIIPKTLKTDPPKAPKGAEQDEQAEQEKQIFEQAEQALEYYNELTKTKCRDAKPFAVLLTATGSRKAYTLQNLKSVVLWVVTTWRRRDNTIAKPANICRVGRFDGYLADAERWEADRLDIDYQAVIDEFNALAAGRLPVAELDEDRERKIHELALNLRHKNSAGICAYLKAFFEDSRDRDFYYGGPNGTGWRANFDYVMKPDTLLKVRRGTL